jgi:hypothetical protein
VVLLHRQPGDHTPGLVSRLDRLGNGGAGDADAAAGVRAGADFGLVLIGGGLVFAMAGVGGHKMKASGIEARREETLSCPPKPWRRRMRLRALARKPDLSLASE